MKNLILSAAVTCGFATFAAAGSPDPTVEFVPTAATGTDWGGFYAGGIASFDGGNLDAFVGDVLISAPLLEPATEFGIFVGYNVQHGSLVFGGEASYLTGGVPLQVQSTSRFTYFADVKARLGYAFGDAFLYGVVGGSFSTFDDSGSSILPSTGFNYGAGIDYLLTDSGFVGAEYLVREISGVADGNPANTHESSIQSSQIRIGWKF